MDAQLAALKLCVEEMGGFNLMTPGERSAYQKRVYLMQLFGVDLGYRFEWYLRGPFSQELLMDGFEIVAHEECSGGCNEDYSLSQRTREQIAAFNKMMAHPIPEGLKQEEWLELLASVHYLARVAYAADKKKMEREQAVERLCRIMPRYKTREADCAWETLAACDLL